MIANSIGPDETHKANRALQRMQRNLNRLIEMQYRIEDIMRKEDYRTYYMLSTLLDVCADLLEAQAASECGDERLSLKLRAQIEAAFGPRQAVSEPIQLNSFVKAHIPYDLIKAAHRDCRIETHLETTEAVLIPSKVLKKTLVGLIRNAVENTPDKGRIEVRVYAQSNGAVLEVTDYGVGITAENQALIFHSNFSTRDTMQYSSGSPYQFNAGGRGFDLLRMQIFSERFGFKIEMVSRRCKYIPTDGDLCPGDIARCPHCRSVGDCENSGGSVFRLHFPLKNAPRSG